ncbi:unnamed protein product [Clavelina lepadiformis]|uniref:Uncharacterized protein n=1 Tax=Clavelina lepadiformis TaxID=159417 RepID=A0ABP0FLK1_CLALP
MPSVARSSKLVTRRAWMRICRGNTFCCCCTVRSGASCAGWFNFIVNSLFVGLLVFALARTTEVLDETLELFYNRDFQLQLNNASEPSDVTVGSDGAESDVISAGRDLVLTKTCQITRNGESMNVTGCFCDTMTNYIITTTAECWREERHPKCVCEHFHVANVVLPMMYKSTAIPGLIIIFSILWLTAVESRSIRYVRLMGYFFLASILLQLALQVAFLIYANNVFNEVTVPPLPPQVWIVFAFYAVINIYFLPTLYKYIKLRKREVAQGIEQGLLTSEKQPAQNQPALDVYLEDAFAIGSDVEEDRFQFSKEDVQTQNGVNVDSNNVVEYDFNDLDYKALPATSQSSVDTSVYGDT